MMTCKELIDFLMDYLDDELPADQLELFEKHLEMCPPCKEYLDSYRHTLSLTRACAEEERKKPPKPPEELIQAILAAKGRASSGGDDSGRCCGA